MNLKIELDYLSQKKQTPYWATICELTAEMIHDILELHPIINASLSNKDDFYFDDYDFYKHQLDNGGTILGCYVDDKLIAYGVLTYPKFDEDNLGYDLKFDQDNLLKVAHLDSFAVHPDYRGNHLQYKLCKLFEEIASKAGYCHLCSTVSPDNKHSLNNLLKLGLEVALEKTKYGGKQRLILYKSLQ